MRSPCGCEYACFDEYSKNKQSRTVGPALALAPAPAPGLMSTHVDLASVAQICRQTPFSVKTINIFATPSQQPLATPHEPHQIAHERAQVSKSSFKAGFANPPPFWTRLLTSPYRPPWLPFFSTASPVPSIAGEAESGDSRRV